MKRLAKLCTVSAIIGLLITYVLIFSPLAISRTDTVEDCGPPPVIDCGFDPLNDYSSIKAFGFPLTVNQDKVSYSRGLNGVDINVFSSSSNRVNLLVDYVFYSTIVAVVLGIVLMVRRK